MSEIHYNNNNNNNNFNHNVQIHFYFLFLYTKKVICSSSSNLFHIHKIETIFIFLFLLQNGKSIHISNITDSHTCQMQISHILCRVLTAKLAHRHQFMPVFFLVYWLVSAFFCLFFFCFFAYTYLLRIVVHWRSECFSVDVICLY